jgi:ABC-type xylose transport system permease subunit
MSHARRRDASIVNATSETIYLSIFDERVPRRKWSFHRETPAAAALLFPHRAVAAVGTVYTFNDYRGCAATTVES